MLTKTLSPALNVLVAEWIHFTLFGIIRLMVKILHYLKDPKLWELQYIPSYGSCRILTINRTTQYKTKTVQFWGLMNSATKTLS